MAKVIPRGANQLVAISAAGDLYNVTIGAGRGVLSPTQSARKANDTYRFNHTLELGDGRVALFDEVNGQGVIYDPKAGQLQRTTYRMGGDAAACSPVAFRDGVLVPMRGGEIAVFNPASGTPQYSAYHPKLGPGEAVQWSRPALVKNGKQFVIANDRNEVYQILVKSGKQPFLQSSLPLELDAAVGDRLAALEDAVFGVLRRPTGDVVVTINARNKLEVAKTEFPLKGRVVWGPEKVGNTILVVSNQEGLMCFDGTEDPTRLDASGSLRWKSEVKYGPLAGPPAQVGEDFVAASVRGVVWRIQGADGVETGKVDVGYRLSGSPVAFGGKIVVSAADGTLHMIDAP